MASITKYAGTVTQTTGGSYVSWSNLANIKNAAENSWATSSTRIKGKSSSPNRPSPVMCTNFSFNLPTGAEVSKVTVTYRHKKVAYNGHTPNIPAPTISLLGVSGFSGKGSAPTTSMTTYTKVFTTSKITRTQVNSSSFGVKIDYPANTNSYEGTMAISFVRVTVEYKVPSYTVTVKKAEGGYNNEEFSVECSISNKNLTSYNPTLTLSAPAGFSYKRAEGTGTATRVNNRTVTWNPSLTSKTGTSTIRMVFDVDVTYPTGTSSYTGTFTLVESLYSTTGNYTATITDRPVDYDETDDNPSSGSEEYVEFLYPKIWDMTEGEPFTVTFKYNPNEPLPDDPQYSGIVSLSFYHYNNHWEDLFEIECETGTLYPSNSTLNLRKSLFVNNECTVIFTPLTTFRDTVYMYFSTSDGRTLTYLDLIVKLPEDEMSNPNFALLEPTEEELDRLGDGYNYICQADIKHTTTDDFVRDWYKNNRIGVFNNNIENVSDYTNLTSTQIYENAQYWAKSTAGLNEYSSVECEFTYNSNYPLYVIITGDYYEAETSGFDVGTVKYDEPCIIEKNSYNGREANGNYPLPIENLLSDTDMSTITLAANETGTPIRVYDFPLDDDYGTNESLAIRGIQVIGTLESSDNLILYAKLINPNGEIGQRSIVLNTNSTDSFTIGGLGDLWGFTTLQMTNLEDWQVELSASNILATGESFLNIQEVQIVFYLETIDKQEITIKINDEDIAYYGAFIEAINIPEGLNTDTSFITVDGTDMNDAYRQNIREKTITVNFNISECDLKTSTDLLRQITKLFTNEKDQYNRPIPKRITFSHYPEDYFEYIMETPFEVSTNISDYDVTAKLTIPAGTSYSRTDTVTNTVGNANGLAASRPIITIQPSGANIEIKEALSKQSFNMSYGGTWTDKIVEINCDDRQVLLKKDAGDDGIDISKYVDHNSDWFRLFGEFNFEAVNCVIRTVSFNERW